MPWSQSTHGHFWEILCSLLQGPGTFSEKQNQKKKKKRRRKEKNKTTWNTNKSQTKPQRTPISYSSSLDNTSLSWFCFFPSLSLSMVPQPCFFLFEITSQTVSTQVLFCEVSRLTVNPWLAVRFLCVFVWDLCLEWPLCQSWQRLWSVPWGWPWALWVSWWAPSSSSKACAQVGPPDTRVPCESHPRKEGKDSYLSVPQTHFRRKRSGKKL